MSNDIISKKTRLEFREFLVGWVLREIEKEFESVDIKQDSAFDPQISGQRRTLVEQYYHTLNFSDPSDMRRLLKVYENIIIKQEQNINNETNKYIIEGMQKASNSLKLWLEKDGFKFEKNKIVPANYFNKKIFEINPFNKITTSTRNNIIDSLQIAKISWAGNMLEPDFLARLFDLNKMPSEDSRFKNAYADIYQHRVMNEDWDSDWVFYDSRFDLKNCEDEAFLNFLCQMLHPVIRTDINEVKQLLDIFNKCLKPDGWEIAETADLFGKPIFAGRPLAFSEDLVSPAKQIAKSINTEYISKQLNRMQTSIDLDPELAIGTAKEFVETICKTLLIEMRVPINNKCDLPDLVKLVRENLELLPNNIPEKAKGYETIKRVLSNLATIAQGLCELRGFYGTGHGKSANTGGIKPRHARLTVGAATTLGVFLYETYQEKKMKT